MNFPPDNTVNDLGNFGFDFATVVQASMTVEPTRICLGIYVVGKTSVICAGLIDAVTLP